MMLVRADPAVRTAPGTYFCRFLTRHPPPPPEGPLVFRLVSFAYPYYAHFAFIIVLVRASGGNEHLAPHSDINEKSEFRILENSFHCGETSRPGSLHLLCRRPLAPSRASFTASRGNSSAQLIPNGGVHGDRARAPSRVSPRRDSVRVKTHPHPPPRPVAPAASVVAFSRDHAGLFL